MHDTRYLALLRGINVGGNNIIAMADLRAAFETLGFTNVQTYIQSGNVIFSGPTHIDLAALIEPALARQFRYQARVVVITHAVLAQIVAEAPVDFGADPERYHYDVIFLRPPMTPTEALRIVETRPEVDSAHGGTHAIYFQRLAVRASQSRLPRLVGKPAYQFMTIRNWNTTTRLLALMNETQTQRQPRDTQR